MGLFPSTRALSPFFYSLQQKPDFAHNQMMPPYRCPLRAGMESAPADELMHHGRQDDFLIHMGLALLWDGSGIRADPDLVLYL